MYAYVDMAGQGHVLLDSDWGSRFHLLLRHLPLNDEEDPDSAQAAQRALNRSLAERRPGLRSVATLHIP